MKTNYHTHTKRCKHAQGEDEEYVLSAIENGYEVLGFSDHTPWAYKEPFSSSTRMDLDMIEDYVISIRELKEKYASKIEILLGLECEYFPEYMDSLKEMIKKYDIDYIIFGNHFYKTDEYREYYGRVCSDDIYMERYLMGAIEGLKTGLYSYLCHPDVFMRARRVFDDVARDISYKICRYAKENDVLLEYNLEGMRIEDEGREAHYPCAGFWKIASEVGNKAIIGVDAHRPDSLATDHYRSIAKKRLSDLSIEVVDELPFKF